MQSATGEPLQNQTSSCVALIGAGTVGRAILRVHLEHGFDVVLADVSHDALRGACDLVSEHYRSHRIQWLDTTLADLPAVRFAVGHPSEPWLVIESIPENLPLKHGLVLALQKAFGSQVIFASNTSNLRIADVFAPLPGDPRCCGLHFFMPVEERPLVEFVATATTSAQTRAACQTHGLRIGKQTLFAQDSPGFVVNRLLAPYLNQSLLMLEYGVQAEQLEAAAQVFGMPMSPLKLIDTIGLRTAFDSGRVFWQAFPSRLDPASILPGMLKARRKQIAAPCTFLNADSLSDIARRVIAAYQREQRHWSTQEIAEMISVPMWIEAAELLATQGVEKLADIELAMSGGLGYRRSEGFFGFFESLGRQTMLAHCQSGGRFLRALHAPGALLDCLEAGSNPRDAIMRYVEQRRMT